MTVNVGNADRVVRAIAGLLLILLPFVSGFGAGSAVLTWGSVAVGAILAATAAFKFCPLYRLVGANTCSR
ncbi:MAG: YgaP family membrane protein [Marinosulfonomonas sp.]